jgi:peptidoglycan/LPS O-acetylase OafA/YrhL
MLSLSRIGGTDKELFWMNGLYEALCIILVFPFIVYMGASGSIKNKTVETVCRFLGDISYPVYIIHYPLAYIFIAWVINKHKTFAEAWPAGLLVLVSSVTLAYICLRIYDLPVRKWLTKKLLPQKSK